MFQSSSSSSSSGTNLSPLLPQPNAPSSSFTQSNQTHNPRIDSPKFNSHDLQSHSVETPSSSQSNHRQNLNLNPSLNQSSKTPPSFPPPRPQTGSKLLNATSPMIHTTNTCTPFTTIPHHHHHHHPHPQQYSSDANGRSLSKSTRTNFNQSNSGHPNFVRSRQVSSTSNQNRPNGFRKEHGVSQTVGNHRSDYPTKSGKFITVVPPLDFPSDLPQNRSLPPSASSSASHVRRGTLMPLYPTLGGQLWAIAREYGLPSIGGLVIFLADDGSGNPGPRVGESTWNALWDRHFQDDEEDYEVEEEEDEEEESFEDYHPEDRDGLTEEERSEMQLNSPEDWSSNENENLETNQIQDEVVSNSNSTSADSPSESSGSPDARLQRRYLSRAPFDSSEGKARRAAALKAAREQARREAGKLEEEEESDDSSDSQSTHDGSGSLQPSQSQSYPQIEPNRTRSGTVNPNSRNPMPYAHERQQNQCQPTNGNRIYANEQRSASQSYSQSQSQSHSYSNSSPASRSGSSRFAPRGTTTERANNNDRRRVGGGGGGRSKGSTSTSNSTSRQSQNRSRQSQRSYSTSNASNSLPIIGRIEWAVEKNRIQGQWWKSWIDQAAEIQAQSQRNQNGSLGYDRRALNSSAENGNYPSQIEEQEFGSNGPSRKENARRSLHLLNSVNLTPRSQVQKSDRHVDGFNSSPYPKTLTSRSVDTRLQSGNLDQTHPESHHQQSMKQSNGRNFIESAAPSTRSTDLSGSDEQVGSLSQPRSSMRFSIADSRIGNGTTESQVNQNAFTYPNDRASSVFNDGYAFGSRARSEKGFSFTSSSTGAGAGAGAGLAQSATREGFEEMLARNVREKEMAKLKNGKPTNGIKRGGSLGSEHSSNADVRGNLQSQDAGNDLEDENHQDHQKQISRDQPIISSEEMDGILLNSTNSTPLRPRLLKDQDAPNSLDSDTGSQRLQKESLGVEGLGLRADPNQSSSRTPSVRSGGDSASYAGFSTLMGYHGENEGSAIHGLSSGGANGREKFFDSSEDGKVEEDQERDNQDLRGQYAALEDDDGEHEDDRAATGSEEEGNNLPNQFQFNARAIDDDEGDEGMWRSLQDEKVPSHKDHLSATGSGDHTHRQSFTPSFGDHFNPNSKSPSLSPNSLQAHLSAAERERSRQRERNGPASPEALAVHDWIQKTSAPALSNLDGMEDEGEEDPGVLPPEDDMADVLDLWARKLTSGEELPSIQEGNSYESSVHGAIAEKVQHLAAERAAKANPSSQYRESLTKPQSEKDSPEQNLTSQSNQIENSNSLLSPITLDTGTFGGPKPQLSGTDSSSIQSSRLSSSDGSKADHSQSREIAEEPAAVGGLTPQNLSLNLDTNRKNSSSPLKLNPPTSPGGRSMTSSTDSLGDLERALDLLSPVVSNHGESNSFQSSSKGGKSRLSRPFEKMSSRDSLAAARTLSTSVTPSPRWLSKNKAITSIKLSPRPASASAISNRPDVITSRVAASRIRTQPPASSRELANIGRSLAGQSGLNPNDEEAGFNPRFISQAQAYDLKQNFNNQDGDWIPGNGSGNDDDQGGIRSTYEVVMNGRPALKRKGSRNREISEDGINSAPEESNYQGVDSIVSPISAPEKGLDFASLGGDFSKQSSPEIGFDGFAHYQDQHHANSSRSQSKTRGGTSRTSSISPETTSRFQDSRQRKTNSNSLSASPSSSNNDSSRIKDGEDHDETMVIHSERSSMNRPPTFPGNSLQPSQSDSSGLVTRTNSHPDLSAANSDTHHEDGPDFKMESRRVSRDFLGDSSRRTRDPSSSSLNTPASFVQEFNQINDQGPEAREALVAKYIQHGRDGSVTSIENPSSIQRLLRGESFAESSVNGSSPQASPNLVTPVLSPAKEEAGAGEENTTTTTTSSSRQSGFPLPRMSSSGISNAQTRQTSEVDAGGSTVRGAASASDSERWSQDGSEYGEESHYEPSHHTAAMRLSEVSAYSQNDYSRIENEAGGKEAAASHTPTFAFDQALSNESRPTSYVPSSLGMNGEGTPSADQSQSTSVGSAAKSSPVQSRTRSSTGGHSMNESVTGSLDEMLNQIGNEFSNTPQERSLGGNLNLNKSNNNNTNNNNSDLHEEEEHDLGEYDVMRRSTEQAVRQALVGPNDFNHERPISVSSRGIVRNSSSGSPKPFIQLRGPASSPRKSSLEEINPPMARGLSQSPRHRFKDLPPSPSLLATFSNSPKSPNLEVSSTSPRSAGSESFDLS